MVLSSLACRDMPPLTPSFEKLCKSMSISIPSRNDRLPFLANAAVPPPVPPTSAALNERCATLAWARQAVVSGVDPDTWPSLVDASLLPRLLALYALPPARTSDGQISDMARLARVVALYLPDDPVPASSPASPPASQPPPPPHPQLQQSPPQHPHPPPGTGFPINTARTAPAPVSPTHSIIEIPDASTPLPSAGSKRKAWMMHTELAALLPEAVYAALDSTVGLSASERSKVLSACKKNDIASLLDHATAAPFGHQFTLALHDGAHFDAVRRGLALAAAGRSAQASAHTLSAAFDHVTRDAMLMQLKTSWAHAESAFHLPTELSGTLVNNLWTGVTFIFRLRADRARSWGVPEVADACALQLAALPAYRTSIADAVARAAEGHTVQHGAHPVNVAYAHFFVPFWWEHILARAMLTEATAASTIKTILERPVTATPPAAVALPTPFAPAVQPAYFPPAQQQHVPHALGQAHGYAPPPPPYWPSVPPALPNSARGGRITAGAPSPRPFLGKPVSGLVIGNNIALASLGPGRPCSCAIASAYPGRLHRPFECPIRFHQHLGQCPGWTAAGARIPSCWISEDLTPACRAEWANFAKTLPSAHAAAGIDVVF